MKKLYTTLIAIVAIVQISYAQTQWTTSGSNIYNSNTGYVGVGTSNPAFRLDVAAASGTAEINIARFYNSTNSNYTTLSASGTSSVVPTWTNGSQILEFVAGTSGKGVIDSYQSPLVFQTGRVDRLTINNSGYIGIGTTNPLNRLDVQNGNASIYNNGALTSLAVGSAAIGKTNISLSTSADASGYGILQSVSVSGSVYGNTSINPNGGNVGVGLTNPQSKFHLVDAGTSINATSQYSGNLIIQGNSGGRSSTLGASLEFVIPANTDGTNSWGQARIITVAANGSSSNATGMLVLGTRRSFDKGAGAGWNYGDDLVIDGNGNIGVNTKDTKTYKFAVNGSAIATSMTVKLYANWPDYVFKKDYNLPSLSDVKAYIDQNQHLPEMPSEAEVAKDGINLGEIVKLQTKKIEELTLYLIDKDKQLSNQNVLLKDQSKAIKQLQQQVDILAKKLNN